MKASSLNTTLAILGLVLWTNTSISWTRPASLLIPRVNNIIPDVQNAAPSGWQRLDFEGKFSFYLPPDMRLTGRGLDSFTREYSNGRTHIRFDYEPDGHLAYESRAMAFGKDFKEIELQVDGKKSFLFVYQAKDRKNRPLHKADLYVGDLRNSEVILSMSVSSRSSQAVETAKTIFHTIKFPS